MLFAFAYPQHHTPHIHHILHAPLSGTCVPHISLYFGLKSDILLSQTLLGIRCMDVPYTIAAPISILYETLFWNGEYNTTTELFNGTH